MAVEILEDSMLKTFLTHSFLGSIFRPYLFSKLDWVRYLFLDNINILVTVILREKSFRKRTLMVIWLVEIPKAFFEKLCLLAYENDHKACKAKEDIKQITDRITYLILSLALWGAKHDSYNKQLSGFEEDLATEGFENVIKEAYGCCGIDEIRRTLGKGGKQNDKEVFINYILQEITKSLDGLSLGNRTGDTILNFKKKIEYCSWKVLNAQYTSIDILNKYMSK